MSAGKWNGDGKWRITTTTTSVTPEPQRCDVGTGHELLRITIAYGTALLVLAGIVAAVLAVTR